MSMPSPLSNPAQQNIAMDQQHNVMMAGQPPNMIRNNNGSEYHKQNQQMNQSYAGQQQNSQMVYNNPMQPQGNRFTLQQQANRSMIFPQNQQPSPNSNSALISQLSTPPQGPGSECRLNCWVKLNFKCSYIFSTKSNDKCSTNPNAPTNANEQCSKQ